MAARPRTNSLRPPSVTGSSSLPTQASSLQHQPACHLRQTATPNDNPYEAMQQQPQVNNGNVRSSNRVRRARHPYSPELYRPVEPTQEEMDTRRQERLMREERRRLAVSTRCHKVILLIDQPRPPRVFPSNDAPPPQWATMRVSWLCESAGHNLHLLPNN